MQIEVRSPEAFLEEFRLCLQDQLEKDGWSRGPKVGAVDRGSVVNYIKESSIISIEISEEAEGRDSRLHLESEEELPEVNGIWDRAVIEYGRLLLKRLDDIAQNKEAVTRDLKK
jgi:hypothetical protein